MKIYGLCMVKNEGDIIETTIRHFLAEGLDKIIIANNLSTDETPKILQNLDEEFPGRLVIIEDEEFGYYQARKMNGWVESYCSDADWVIPFDADEIWYDPSGKTLREFFSKEWTENFGVVNCPVYDMIPFAYTNTNTPVKYITWRLEIPERFPVVAFKMQGFNYLHAGNHGVDHSEATMFGGLVVCHFQYRSFNQYVRKLSNGKAVYDATDLDSGLGFHWREGGNKTIDELWASWIEYCEGSKTIPKPCPAKGQK